MSRFSSALLTAAAFGQGALCVRLDEEPMTLDSAIASIDDPFQSHDLIVDQKAAEVEAAWQRNVTNAALVSVIEADDRVNRATQLSNRAHDMALAKSAYETMATDARTAAAEQTAAATAMHAATSLANQKAENARNAITFASRKTDDEKRAKQEADRVSNQAHDTLVKSKALTSQAKLLASYADKQRLEAQQARVVSDKAKAEAKLAVKESEAVRADLNNACKDAPPTIEVIKMPTPCPGAAAAQVPCAEAQVPCAEAQVPCAAAQVPCAAAQVPCAAAAAAAAAPVAQLLENREEGPGEAGEYLTVAGVDTEKWPQEKVKELQMVGVLPSEETTCPEDCAAYSWSMMCEIPLCVGCDQCVNWDPVESNMAAVQKEQLLLGHYWPGGPCSKCKYLPNEEACGIEACQNCKDFGIYCTPKIPEQEGCDARTEQEKKDAKLFAGHEVALEGLATETKRQLALAAQEKEKKDAEQANETAEDESNDPALKAVSDAIKETTEEVEAAQANETAESVKAPAQAQQAPPQAQQAA